MVTVINFHKLGGLKTREMYYLPFWKPKVCNQFHWAEIKVLRGPSILHWALGRMCSFLLPASAGHQFSWIAAASFQPLLP